MHAFRAKDIDIYKPDGHDENFLAVHLVCLKCKNFWHTALNECYLCGEINYGVGVCSKKHHTSLTTSQKSDETNQKNCKYCNKIPAKKCINDDCPTNKDTVISKIISYSRKEQESGVFEGQLKSSMKISMNYCLKCGHRENKYLQFLVFVEDYDPRTSHDIICKHRKPDHVVIFKNRLPKSIVYAYFEGSHDPANWQPNWTELSQTITQLFS
jgi:hypothetical protein